jgi:hypothetical protein
MQITQKEALELLELLHDHIPQPWQSTEDAVQKLREFIQQQ